jgi:hypothetical protein
MTVELLLVLYAKKGRGVTKRGAGANAEVVDDVRCADAAGSILAQRATIIAPGAVAVAIIRLWKANTSRKIAASNSHMFRILGNLQEFVCCSHVGLV